MDLFGLLAVGPPVPGESRWYPSTVSHTPFGGAVLTLLAGLARGGRFGGAEKPAEAANPDEDEDEGEEGAGEAPFGQWQPLFQPYFPEWQNNLVLPRQEAREGVFVFKVSLNREVWRRIAIDADSTLDALPGGTGPLRQLRTPETGDRAGQVGPGRRRQREARRPAAQPAHLRRRHPGHPPGPQ
jgi:hypothetical protein